MALERAEVEKIAWLARIRIGEMDIPRYTEQLSSILEFVAQMKAVDTTGVEPLAHPMDLSLRLREDEVSEPNQRERLQSGAPRVEAGLYLVPKVIDPQ